MSFDLFVHRFRDGESAPYPSRIAEEIFDRGALRPSGLEYVEYDDGRGEIFCDRDDETFDGFMLSHFGGDTICERALEIAHVTGSLLYWPSTHILFGVTDPSTLEHVPPEIKSDRKIIALVRSVRELWAAINAEEGSDDDVEIIFP